MGVELHLIELQSCWQTDRASGECTVHRTMAHTYSEVWNMKEVLKRPSQTLLKTDYMGPIVGSESSMNLSGVLGFCDESRSGGSTCF